MVKYEVILRREDKPNEHLELNSFDRMEEADIYISNVKSFFNDLDVIEIKVNSSHYKLISCTPHIVKHL